MIEGRKLSCKVWETWRHKQPSTDKALIVLFIAGGHGNCTERESFV